MTPHELRKRVLVHLENPIRPLKKEALGEAAAWVQFPTKEKCPGGLTAEGQNQFAGDQEVLKAAAEHKEQTRIKINAVIGTCALFYKNYKKTITEKELNQLVQGIPIKNPDGSTDHIKTTRKHGETLTPVFKKMCKDIGLTLLSHDPNRIHIIRAAHQIDSIHAKKEAQQTQNVAQMA